MRLIPLAAALALFVGCGYKGPLYLPDSKPEARKPGGGAVVDPARERPLPSDAAPSPK